MSSRCHQGFSGSGSAATGAVGKATPASASAAASSRAGNAAGAPASAASVSRRAFFVEPSLLASSSFAFRYGS